VELYKTGALTIFWGGKAESILPDKWRGFSPAEIMNKEPFKSCVQVAEIEQFTLATLRQMHGTDGVVVLTKEQCAAMPLFSCTADYLVTQLKGVGLVVLTADCLPLVIYDPVTKAVALVHAGWRGSVEKISKKAVENLCEQYGCVPKNLEVFLGPCALVCCYEVDELFVRALSAEQKGNRALGKRDGKWYFDISLYNVIVLESAGIESHKIHFENNVCTICTSDYCSHRGQPESGGRNITVVSLK